MARLQSNPRIGVPLRPPRFRKHGIRQAASGGRCTRRRRRRRRSRAAMSASLVMAPSPKSRQKPPVLPRRHCMLPRNGGSPASDRKQTRQLFCIFTRQGPKGVSRESLFRGGGKQGANERLLPPEIGPRWPPAPPRSANGVSA